MKEAIKGNPVTLKDFLAHLVQALARGAAIHAVALNEGHEDDLRQQDILSMSHILRIANTT